MSCLCKQCGSRSVGFWSQLIWICTVCHSPTTNNLDQVIWLAENWKWVWRLNLFSMARVNTQTRHRPFLWFYYVTFTGIILAPDFCERKNPIRTKTVRDFQIQWDFFFARSDKLSEIFLFFFCKGQILYQNCMYKYYYCLFCNVL